MSSDRIFSLMYCGFCGLLLVPLILIMFKILAKRKESRDLYSIFTFLFMSMMLFVRAITIYPIVANNENLNDKMARCEELFYSGTPINLFSLSILIHTSRWFKLQVKLMSSKTYPK